MDDLTIARKLHAAAIAVEQGGAYPNRDLLVALCAEVQGQLTPPSDDLTWRSSDGRVWKICEMSDDHLINALRVLGRRPNESQSPLFLPLLDEAKKRLDASVGRACKGRRMWFRHRIGQIEEMGVMNGWLETWMVQGQEKARRGF